MTKRMQQRLSTIERMLDRGDNAAAARALSELSEEAEAKDQTRIAELHARVRMDPRVIVVSAFAGAIALAATLATYIQA